MNSKEIVLMLSNLLLATFFYAQHQDVFPNLEGDDLLQALVQDYKPNVPFSYGQARDTMFSKVDAQNDSLTCVYTGYTIYLDPSKDPTEAAFMNDGPDAINTEHTYPQGLGATGNARSDMHHLFPTRKDVNGARLDFPFGDINDAFTNSWWYGDDEQSSIPSQNIDWYSEEGNGIFEPREDHKGDVARAMMYFYTMYKAQADAENPSYFSNQLPTLCAWHHQDPVSQKEWERTWKIAPYQSDLPNPFVLDCTLPKRCYCSDVDLTCSPISNIKKTNPSIQAVSISPNPFSDQFTIEYHLKTAANIDIGLYDLTGRRLATISSQKQAVGMHRHQFQKANDISAGLMFLRLVLTNDKQQMIWTEKIVLSSSNSF